MAELVVVRLPVDLVRRAEAVWPKSRQHPDVAAQGPRDSTAAAVRAALFLGVKELEASSIAAPGASLQAIGLEQARAAQEAAEQITKAGLDVQAMARAFAENAESIKQITQHLGQLPPGFLEALEAFRQFAPPKPKKKP